MPLLFSLNKHPSGITNGWFITEHQETTATSSALPSSRREIYWHLLCIIYESFLFCFWSSGVVLSQKGVSKPEAAMWNTQHWFESATRVGAACSFAAAEMVRKDDQPKASCCCFHFTWISDSNRHTMAPPGQHLTARKRGDSSSLRAAFPSLLQPSALEKPKFSYTSRCPPELPSTALPCHLPASLLFEEPPPLL